MPIRPIIIIIIVYSFKNWFDEIISQNAIKHYIDVMISAMASQSIGVSVV